jgi:uncharacterized peroxidase-related enzyme
MAFIELVDDDEFAAAERRTLGYTPNYTRLFARRPEVYAAWRDLNVSIRDGMGRRRYEIATLAAAKTLRSSYCALAHGKVLLEKFGLRPGDPLDDEERAIQDLARKVAEDAASVTEDDVERLRGVGLTDDEIFDVVLAAAARCFFSKTLDGLGVQPDAAYRALDPDVRDALTVGRPIED